ncbi:MAG: CPBP family intramembrane glutamic endopeptidase [Chloroflexota bacterium]|nr:CPBP family intramembrane glutamic endopeptidase [Chloroflexota bacterium]
MEKPLIPKGENAQQVKRKALTEAIIALLVFYGLSFLSRFFAPLLLLVVGIGLLFPVIWGMCTKDWKTMGFTRRNIGQALVWGTGGGILLMVVIWFTTEHKLAPFFALQLIVGIPIWLLVMSPFQEFFFRGWLQPRFEKSLGLWSGLVVTSVGFAVWHLFPPFEQAQIVPIMSISGMAFTTMMGLVFGYTFRRTGNIVAPWLAHVLAGLTLVLSGAMTFVQFVE